MTKSDPNNQTVDEPARNTSLYTVAIEAHQKAKADNKRKNIAAQKRFVKKLVGAEFFDQCFYNEAIDVWTICGHQFQCLTYCKMCLSYGMGDFHSYIYTLADLGSYLQRQVSLGPVKAPAPSIQDAAAAVVDEMRKVGKPVGNKPSSSGPFSLWRRIRNATDLS